MMPMHTTNGHGRWPTHIHSEWSRTPPCTKLTVESDSTLQKADMRQFDREDLQAEYLRGLAEGRKQGLKMAEDACTALERRKWELAHKTLQSGGTMATVGPLECIAAIRKLT